MTVGLEVNLDETNTTIQVEFSPEFISRSWAKEIIVV
jgi:hypothetical protein